MNDFTSERWKCKDCGFLVWRPVLREPEPKVVSFIHRKDRMDFCNGMIERTGKVIKGRADDVVAPAGIPLPPKYKPTPAKRKIPAEKSNYHTKKRFGFLPPKKQTQS